MPSEPQSAQSIGRQPPGPDGKGQLHVALFTGTLKARIRRVAGQGQSGSGP